MSVERTTLANGLTVATDRMDHLETAALGVWIRTGSRNETDAEHGLAHLLEHMAFKGTRRRTARQIAEEIEAVGGELNAATSHETTAYYARVLKDDVPLALDILADILRDSRFDEAELKREQHVIVQEIGAALDDPQDLVDDLFQKAAFREQPLGRSILGTSQVIATQTPEGLRRYLADHYRAPDMLVAAAGAVEHDAFVRLVEGLFGDLPAEPGVRPGPARYVGGEERAAKDLSETNIVVGFAAPSFLDEGFYAARIAAAVIGGGMSSRLFQTVREARGLAYAIHAFTWAFSDTGVFGVAAATEPGDVPELIDVTTAELSRVVDDVSESEVARARAQLKAGLLMGLESSVLRVEQIARQTLLLGRPLPLDELVERIDRVDAARVRDQLDRIIRRTPVSLAAVGPLESLESAATITQKLGSAARPAA